MQQISITEINARLGALAAQRNAAFDQASVLAGQLALRDEYIAQLEAENKSLKEAAKATTTPASREEAPCASEGGATC